MISAIVLAAGASERMGVPKALLLINGKTFIRHVVDVLNASKVDSIVVVLGAHADVIKMEVAGINVTLAVNENYASGQLSSICTGIEAVEAYHPDAIFLQPVDHPLVQPSVINALIDRFVATSAPVVVPVAGGRRGHPVIFSAAVFDELKNAPVHVGARAVVWSHAREVVELDVGDEGILYNIDTQEDYENLQRYLHRTAG